MAWARRILKWQTVCARDVYKRQAISRLISHSKCLGRSLNSVPPSYQTFIISAGATVRQSGVNVSFGQEYVNISLLGVLSIFAPCHRVIGSNHTLVRYAGGLPAKKRLLDLEINVRKKIVKIFSLV